MGIGIGAGKEKGEGRTTFFYPLTLFVEVGFRFGADLILGLAHW